jgi:hypothetical protein
MPVRWGRAGGSLAIALVQRFTRAREYQTVAGFATDWLPPLTKAPLAALGVGR